MFKKLLQEAIWNGMMMRMQLNTTDKIVMMVAVILAVVFIIILIRWVD